MFKTLLKKMSKPEKVVRPDPTVTWESVEIDSLRVDTVTKRVCSDSASIAFFGGLEEARAFGKPELADYINDGEENPLSLVYNEAGFTLQFGNKGLNYAAFFIGKDAYSPANVTFSKPIINGLKITKATSLEGVLDYFGKPVSREDDDKEILLIYTLNGFTVEFEISLQEKVTRVNFFPAD